MDMHDTCLILVEFLLQAITPKPKINIQKQELWLHIEIITIVLVVQRIMQEYSYKLWRR